MIGETEKFLADIGTGRTCISVTECIETEQAHDTQHVNYKKKQQQIVNLREMKLSHRNYLDLNEKTCLKGFRPCKTQTNLLSNRD